MHSDEASNSDKAILTVPEVCRWLGISRATLYKLRSKGDIRFGKVLGKTVIPRTEIDRFLADIDASLS